MSSAAAPTLPEKPRRRRSLGLVLAAAVLVAAIIIGVAVLATRGGDDDASGAAASSSRTVSIGVADKALPYWTTYTDLAKSELGVTVKLVNFSDYSLPNPALNQGEIDINQFQHIQYLANYNVTAHDDLQPIGATAVYPLPLYSTTVKDPSQFPAGAKIAIPNDAVNEARALLVLQAAKLLTLKDGGNAFSTAADVESSKVEVVPVDASQTANALQSGSAVGAIVNNNYATAAKLPTEDAIFQVDPTSASAAPYVNLFVVREEDAEDKTYLDLAELFHDPAVQKAFLKDYPAAVASHTSAADLQAELAQVEEDAKAAAKAS